MKTRKRSKRNHRKTLKGGSFREYLNKLKAEFYRILAWLGFTISTEEKDILDDALEDDLRESPLLRKRIEYTNNALDYNKVSELSNPEDFWSNVRKHVKYDSTNHQKNYIQKDVPGSKRRHSKSIKTQMKPPEEDERLNEIIENLNNNTAKTVRVKKLAKRITQFTSSD
uniref:Uncharacterized protein n=1 Tax=viral metagenome TaxID=1070528 RepID=A0A6C0HRW0_9ZZZZ